ncbi:MAG: glycosyltransferase, partial [Methylococcaceae bacterium]
MDYWANVDAVVWFAKAIFPLISEQLPSVKFYIVGSKPTKEVLALDKDSIIVTGVVDDIRPYLAYAQIVVAPLRIARGIQNKVLEAMAMEKYVVATTAAMEGIVNQQDLAVTIADNINHMSAEIIRQLQKKIPAHQNRNFVLAQFSWDHSAKQLISLLQNQ